MTENGMASETLRAMDWKAYNHNLLSQDEVDELSKEFGGFFLTKTMTELFQAACERNLMLAPANTAREILASEQQAARHFFVDVTHEGRGVLRHPGPFAIVTSAEPEATAVAIRRPAPRLGEHTDQVLGELGVDVAALRREGVA
jgi:crotonobetainyl-CoA:carnitine CoA-transferase CaiB-like acyl-CoA transferase